MLDDLMKSAKESIVDRMSNPFLFSFAASWCGWNYKFIMILLFGNAVEERIKLIDAVAFPGQCSWTALWQCSGLLSGLVFPLLTSAAFILIYPYPSRLAYWHLRVQQREQNKLRQTIDKETLLTREEMEAREAAMDLQLQEMERRVGQANDQVRQARERENRLEQQLRNLHKETAPSAQVMADAERVKTEANERLAQSAERFRELTASDDRQRQLFAKIAKEEDWPIEKLAKYLSSEQRNVLRILDESGGFVERDALRKDSKLGVQAFRDEVRSLGWFGLIEEVNKESSNGTDRVKLLEPGRMVVREIDRTKPPAA